MFNKKFKTPQESLTFQKEVEEHVVNRDTTILKGEKQIKHLYEKATEWWENV